MYQEESIKITWETKRVVDFGISHIASSMPGMWVSVVALEFFRTLPNGFQGGLFNNLKISMLFRGRLSPNLPTGMNKSQTRKCTPWKVQFEEDNGLRRLSLHILAGFKTASREHSSVPDDARRRIARRIQL